jgi:hypothetical protein
MNLLVKSMTKEIFALPRWLNMYSPTSQEYAMSIIIQNDCKHVISIRLKQLIAFHL